MRDLASERTLSLFHSIRCALRCLTEAAHLSNLHGSKVQAVNGLGWLVQINIVRSRSPQMPSIRVRACFAVLPPLPFAQFFLAQLILVSGSGPTADIQPLVSAASRLFLKRLPPDVIGYIP